MNGTPTIDSKLANSKDLACLSDCESPPLSRVHWDGPFQLICVVTQTGYCFSVNFNLIVDCVSLNIDFLKFLIKNLCLSVFYLNGQAIKPIMNKH